MQISISDFPNLAHFGQRSSRGTHTHIQTQFQFVTLALSLNTFANSHGILHGLISPCTPSLPTFDLLNPAGPESVARQRDVAL